MFSEFVSNPMSGSDPGSVIDNSPMELAIDRIWLSDPVPPILLMRIYLPNFLQCEANRSQEWDFALIFKYSLISRQDRAYFDIFFR